MGKGLAEQFRRAFPDNFKTYEAACMAGEVSPGRLVVHDNGGLFNPRYIVNFPSKRHWRGLSRIEDIESGLQALTDVVQQLGIQSIAIPPLGCGEGKLDWRKVRPLIERAFSEFPDVQVLLFSPSAPQNDAGFRPA